MFTDTIWHLRRDEDDLIDGALVLTLRAGEKYGEEVEYVAGAHIETEEALHAACTLCATLRRPGSMWLVTDGAWSRWRYHITERGTWTAA